MFPHWVLPLLSEMVSRQMTMDMTDGDVWDLGNRLLLSLSHSFSFILF